MGFTGDGFRPPGVPHCVFVKETHEFSATSVSLRGVILSWCGFTGVEVHVNVF